MWTIPTLGHSPDPANNISLTSLTHKTNNTGTSFPKRLESLPPAAAVAVAAAAIAAATAAAAAAAAALEMGRLLHMHAYTPCSSSSNRSRRSSSSNAMEEDPQDLEGRLSL